MNKEKYVFAQLVEFLDCFKFRRIIATTSSNSVAMFMLSTPRPLTSVWRCFGGQSFERRKAVSRYTHYTM